MGDLFSKACALQVCVHGVCVRLMRHACCHAKCALPATAHRCLNAKSLGQTKNVNLPGVHVDIMVLTDKDIDDVRPRGGGGVNMGRAAGWLCCKVIEGVRPASWRDKAHRRRSLHVLLWCLACLQHGLVP